MEMIGYVGYIKLDPSDNYRHHCAVYKCPLCGKHFTAKIHRVNMGRKKSCGCRFHGLGGTRLYKAWGHIIGRCYNERNNRYYRYGGRGITVCDEWKNDFMSFYNWALSNGYADDLTIDRINNDGNYEPSNCRWVTKFVNSQNKGLKSNNTSGYIGVCLVKHNKWTAGITHQKEHYHLGSFSTAKEAAAAYNNWVVEHKTNHTLNVIED